MSNVGIPIKLLYEAESMKITVEWLEQGCCETMVLGQKLISWLHVWIQQGLLNSIVCSPRPSNFLPDYWTTQMKNGETYRGQLLSGEETMNMTLADVVRTARNGQVSNLTSVYLRGGGVRFIALPELLRNAPIFKKVSSLKKKMEADKQSRPGAKRKRD